MITHFFLFLNFAIFQAEKVNEKKHEILLKMRKGNNEKNVFQIFLTKHKVFHDLLKME